MAYDLLFTNARVIDGTGSPWLRADVAVADGRIVAVGREFHGEAARTIDVGNQILAPGFSKLSRWYPSGRPPTLF